MSSSRETRVSVPLRTAVSSTTSFRRGGGSVWVLGRPRWIVDTLNEALEVDSLIVKGVEDRQLTLQRWDVEGIGTYADGDVSTPSGLAGEVNSASSNRASRYMSCGMRLLASVKKPGW